MEALPAAGGVNLYGDRAIKSTDGRGIDIAAQRMDDLDEASVLLIQRLSSCSRPVVYDIGCGQGAHTTRMACAGAHVIAIDIEDNGLAVMAAADAAGVADNVEFFQMDVRSGFFGLPAPTIVYSQRTLHYLRHAEVLRLLRDLAGLPGSISFFLSASGLDSELSTEYPDAPKPVCDRFSLLAPVMQDKHLIRNPVCLYSADDMRDLLSMAELVPSRVYLSPFGNVKAIASTKAP